MILDLLNKQTLTPTQTPNILDAFLHPIIDKKADLIYEINYELRQLHPYNDIHGTLIFLSKIFIQYLDIHI